MSPVESKQRPLTVEEAADFLQLSTSYIYRLIHEKKIPYFKPGRNRAARVYFRVEDLENFVFRARSSADYEIAESAELILSTKRRK